MGLKDNTSHVTQKQSGKNLNFNSASSDQQCISIQPHNATSDNN